MINFNMQLLLLRTLFREVMRIQATLFLLFQAVVQWFFPQRHPRVSFKLHTYYKEYIPFKIVKNTSRSKKYKTLIIIQLKILL